MKPPLPLFFVLLSLVAPVAMAQPPGARGQDVNVNSRYLVENVSFEGVDDSQIDKSLRADIDKLVGQKYDQAAVNALVERLRNELRGYSIDARVRRGHIQDQVTVVFRAERNLNRLNMHASPIVYHSQEAFSATLGVGGETHHNYGSVSWTTTADDLLERNEGWRLRYEHRRVGTSLVQVGVGYDWFHPTFLAPTRAALVVSPDVPGAYRTRQNFAPSVSVLPVNGVTLTFGLSLQNLDFDVPALHTGHAFAFTADAQVQRKLDAGGFRQAIGLAYSLRRATPALESDFVYSRHVVAGDYSLTRHRHGFLFQGRLGAIDGSAPLFERFLLGNSYLLRGWNKFDVAPLGGSRLAYGSLEYRYRPFQIFWDFGSVWDANQPARVRHSVGIGFASRPTRTGGWFLSLTFPVRMTDVGPVLLFGIRQ